MEQTRAQQIVLLRQGPDRKTFRDIGLLMGGISGERVQQIYLREITGANPLKEAFRRYDRGPKGKVAKKKYRKSEKGIVARNRYQHGLKFKASRDRYQKTQKFRDAQKRSKEKKKQLTTTRR